MPKEKLPLPVKVVPLEANRDAALYKAFPGIKDGFMRGEPGGHLMFSKMWEGIHEIHNFQVRPDDVWLEGCLKTGTTWLQEIVWQINHDCDFALAKKTPLLKRVPTLELSYTPYVLLDVVSEEKPGAELPSLILPIEGLNQMASPRHFKTHMPLHLLPPDLLNTAKVVYLARNPKDVIVSYFHFHQLATKLNFTGNVEEFAEFYMRDEVARTPFFNHVLEAWKLRDHPNLHFVFYEDLKSNLRGEIEKIAKFLGKTLSEDKIEALLKHSTIDSCRKHINTEDILRPTGLISPTGTFFRKGKTGDWKNHFSPETNAKLDEWIERNLAGTDLSFKMELDQQD